MKLLAIESSTMVASVALATEDCIVAEYSVNNKKTHSQTLLPMIDEIVKSVGWKLGELDYIAVTSGPGSFTGLRIGAATAKGIAQALDKPVIAVPTLEALALGGVCHSGLIVSIMDARREHVFAGIYKMLGGKLSIVQDQVAISVQELIEKLNDMNEEVLFIGDGIKAYSEKIAEKMQVDYKMAPVAIREIKASSLVQRAYDYIEEGKITTSAGFVLDYLRKSQAERELEERQKAAK